MAATSTPTSVADLGMGRAPSTRPNSTGFDSLQELLEREGYKETRIVTPVSKGPVVLSIDEADELPDAFNESENKYPDIHAWMKGMIAAQANDSVPQRPPLHTSQSEATLRPQPRLRRSMIWDASRAYHGGAPAPAKAAPAKAAPALPAPPLSFLAEPAKPVVSRADAVGTREEEPRMPMKSVRRTKSQDLLHKALKNQKSTKNIKPPPPLCSCGRANPPRSALSWRRSSVSIEPQWHAHDCPVRLSWELTATSPVPPAPPSLYVSTPSGMSAPRYLELAGREYEPRDLRVSEFRRLFSRVPHPRLTLVKRATIAGLYGLFRDPDPFSEPYRRVSSPYRRPRSPRKHRSSRTVSVPHLRRSSSFEKIGDEKGLRPERTPSVRKGMEPRSPPRTLLPSTTTASGEFSMLDKYQIAASPDLGKENCAEESLCPTLMESPTMYRATHRGVLRRPLSVAALGESLPPVPTETPRAADERTVLAQHNKVQSTPPPRHLPYRQPTRVPVSRSKLDLRKPSKTRPAPANDPAEARESMAGHAHHEPAEERDEPRTHAPIRRTQSSKMLKVQRKPSAMTLGLGLALPSAGAPALFVEGASSTSYGSTRSFDSGFVSNGEARRKQAIPPVPPIPPEYTCTSHSFATNH